MSDQSANNKRIAKNTILLSIRMVFVLFLGLYTTRVALNALGVDDLGIYNVVGGFVSMFVFLSSSITFYLVGLNAGEKGIVNSFVRKSCEFKKLTSGFVIYILD